MIVSTGSYNLNLVWDTGLLEWVPETQPGGGSGGGTSSSFGSAFPAVGTAAGFIGSTGNMAGGNLDASGNLKVLVGNASIAITAAALPLPSNASQETGGNLASIKTDADAISAVLGVTSGAAVITDANGTIQQYLRGLIKLFITAGGALVTATLAAGSAIIGKVGIDQTTPGTTNAVSIAQIGATIVVTGGANGSLAIGGTQANNVAITSNPLLNGAEARQDQGGTNATAGRITQIIADRNGRLITISPKITQISSNGTPITTATTTDAVSAPGANTHLKIYRIHASNAGATPTWVYWVDSNGTTKLYPSYLPTNGIVSLDLNGRWELTSNKKLQINTSAAGSVEWHVDYESVPD